MASTMLSVVSSYYNLQYILACLNDVITDKHVYMS